MYIGEKLNNRMKLLNIDIKKLSTLSFVDESYIESILNDSIAYDNIDKFDLSLIADVLHCVPEYFIDDNIKNNDLLMQLNSCNCKDKEVIKAISKLQDYVNDFNFIRKYIV